MNKEIEIQKEFRKWKKDYGVCKFSFWEGDIFDMLVEDWKSAIKMLRPKKNEKILDLACGIGLATIEIAKRVKTETTYGIDITKELIDEARKNAKKANIKNIKFRQSSVKNLPFRDNTFDGMICTNAAHHFHKPLKMFNEIRRVLKNDKKFILIDTCATSKRIQEFERKLKKEEKAHYKFFGLKEIKDILNKTGFSKVEGYRKNYNFYIKAKK
jgi:ubiquinone/menaquinone biosynthesis C-methylase UbiE